MNKSNYYNNRTNNRRGTNQAKLSRKVIKEIAINENEKKSISMFDDTMNETNPDVTIEFSSINCSRSNLKTSFTTFNDTLDYSQMTLFNETRIVEEPEELSREDLRQRVCLYIIRRPLINLKRNCPDTYFPFEMNWFDWAPSKLTFREATKHATALSDEISASDFDKEQLCNYLKSLSISTRGCSLCKVRPSDLYEMFQHNLSFGHIEKVYSSESHCISWIDVFAANKIIDESRKFRSSAKPIKLAKKGFFFEESNVSTAVNILKCGIQIQQTVPLLMAIHPNDDDCCEYIESLILLRELQHQFEIIDNSINQKYIGQFSPVKCEVCDDVVQVSFFHSFVSHFASEKHIQMSIEKGIRRVEGEYWLGFCSAVRRTKKTSRIRAHSDVSLQESEFPLCIESDPTDGDLKYCGVEATSMINFIKDQVMKYQLIFDDEEISTRCQWCSLEIHCMSELLKHILYDEVHFKKLDAISNKDVRELFKTLRIPITVPIFGYPGKDVGQSNVIVTNNRKLRIETKFRRFATGVNAKVILQSKFAFPLPLVNYCDICEKHIDDIRDVVPHLESNEHWTIMRDRHHWMEEDFNYWWNIFGMPKNLV